MICLDTDVVSAALRSGGGPAVLARRLGVVPVEEQCVTAITVGELVYGALKRGSTRLQADIERVLAGIHVTPFDDRAARIYAEIRVQLEYAGLPLDASDLRIAATCLARDHLLVTRNMRHFERVPGLRVENWLE